jgi:hypothetical protein
MIGDKFQPRAAFRAIKIIFYALNTGLLLFFMVGVYLNGMRIPSFKQELDVLTIVSLFLLATIPVGYYISNRKFDAIDAGEPFSAKWEQFQSAMIIRWAMIEGAALFSLVGLIVLQDAKQLILFIICILVLSTNSVNKEQATRLAKLNPEESKALGEG